MPNATSSTFLDRNSLPTASLGAPCRKFTVTIPPSTFSQSYRNLWLLDVRVAGFYIYGQMSNCVWLYLSNRLVSYFSVEFLLLFRSFSICWHVTKSWGLEVFHVALRFMGTKKSYFLIFFVVSSWSLSLALASERSLVYLHTYLHSNVVGDSREPRLNL